MPFRQLLQRESPGCCARRALLLLLLMLMLMQRPRVSGGPGLRLWLLRGLLERLRSERQLRERIDSRGRAEREQLRGLLDALRH